MSDEEWQRWMATYAKEGRPIPPVMGRARTDRQRALIGLTGVYALGGTVILAELSELRQHHTTAALASSLFTALCSVPVRVCRLCRLNRPPARPRHAPSGGMAMLVLTTYATSGNGVGSGAMVMEVSIAVCQRMRLPTGAVSAPGCDDAHNRTRADVLASIPMVRAVWRPFAVLGLQIVVNGCASPESLQVRGPNQAVVGELATFYYSINPNCGKVFGGPSDPTATLCPPSDSISKLVDATCDGGACVLDTVQPSSISNGGLTLNVVGTTAGPTVLRVRVSLNDGSQMTMTSPLSFVTATGLHLTCALAVYGDGFMPPYGQCGGLYPVFTDSSWRWTVAFDTDQGLLGVADPSFSVQGNTVTFDSASRSFQSGSTNGTAQVVISSREFTKTVPVRVVSTSDIVSGELRLVKRADGIEQEIAQIGPAPSTLWYPTRNGLAFDGDDPGGVAIQPLLTLSDGTQVYGGGGYFASDHPAVCTVGPLSAAANLVQQTTVSTDCRSDGSATFAATVGAATITWPVTVAPPPSP